MTIEQLRQALLESILVKTKVLQERKYTHEMISKVIDNTRARTTNLINGKIDKFSLDMLFQIANKLDVQYSVVFDDKAYIKPIETPRFVDIPLRKFSAYPPGCYGYQEPA